MRKFKITASRTLVIEMTEEIAAETEEAAEAVIAAKLLEIEIQMEHEVDSDEVTIDFLEEIPSQ